MSNDLHGPTNMSWTGQCLDSAKAINKEADDLLHQNLSHRQGEALQDMRLCHPISHHKAQTFTLTHLDCEKGDPTPLRVRETSRRGKGQRKVGDIDAQPY